MSAKFPQRPRILFFDHESRLSGGERDLVDLAHALNRGRFELRVALPGPGPLSETFDQLGVPVTFIKMSPRLRRLSRWRLASAPISIFTVAVSLLAVTFRLGILLRRTRPDLVHTNSMKAHLLAVVPCKVLRIPLIWHIRDILEPGWLRSLLLAVARWGPERIICISRATVRAFMDNSRAFEKVMLVYNGIHLRRFDVVANGWRRRLGAQNGEVVIGLVGQIAWWKGQDVFVEAAGRLTSAHPKVRFAIIGDCLFPENESVFHEGVRKRAAELGLSDRLVWTGWVEPIPKVMAALDVSVHASRLPEPFGRVVVEAMAAGTPVVSTTNGAGPELVPAEAGCLVPPGDPEALASALEALIQDTSRRVGMSSAARRAAGRFDIAETAKGVERVWTGVLG